MTTQVGQSAGEPRVIPAHTLSYLADGSGPDEPFSVDLTHVHGLAILSAPLKAASHYWPRGTTVQPHDDGHWTAWLGGSSFRYSGRDLAAVNGMVRNAALYTSPSAFCQDDGALSDARLAEIRALMEVAHLEHIQERVGDA